MPHNLSSVFHSVIIGLFKWFPSDTDKKFQTRSHDQIAAVKNVRVSDELEMPSYNVLRV